MDFSKRLKEERMRLEMTQDEMAKAGGVSRRAQVSYEAGASFPDARYIEGVVQVGVDAMYLATGKRRGDEKNQVAAAEFLLSGIAEELGLRGDSFSQVWEELVSLIPNAIRSSETHTWVDTSVIQTTCSLRVKELMARAPGVMNEPLIAAVVQAVEEAVLAQGVSIAPEKKARIVLISCRQAVSDGRIDLETLKDAILLAL